MHQGKRVSGGSVSSVLCMSCTLRSDEESFEVKGEWVTLSVWKGKRRSIVRFAARASYVVRSVG